MKKKLKEKIEKIVLEKLTSSSSYKYIQNLHQDLGKNSDLYIVGGFPRDAARHIIEKTKFSPEDIDIIVGSSKLPNVIKTKEGDISYTALGGFRWKPKENLQIDVWEAEKSKKRARIRERSTIKNYFNTSYLNLDYIAFNFQNNKLIDEGCIETIKNKTLELKFKGNKYKPPIGYLARTIFLKNKLNYELGENLLESIKNNQTEIIESIKKKCKKDNYAEKELNKLIDIAMNI